MNTVIILINDTLVMAERPVVAMIQMIITMLHLMGFSISWDKSALILSQEIQLLGFVVNSGAMTSYVTTRREGQEHGAWQTILKQEMVMVRELFRVF